MHRAIFRDRVISELLPPLEPDGSSRLWNHFGRRFTGLSYSDADLLSKETKEFIRALFPHGLIYTSLFPEEVREVIGVVGPETKGVEKMLRRIGFESEVVPAGTLTGQLLTIARERQAQVVLLSNLPPSGFVQIRYACKRLAQIEGLVVLVGVWGTERDVEKVRARLPQGSFHVVRTLAEAAAEAGRLFQSPQVESSPERSSDVAVRPPAAAV